MKAATCYEIVMLVAHTPKYYFKKSTQNSDQNSRKIHQNGRKPRTPEPVPIAWKFA